MIEVIHAIIGRYVYNFQPLLTRAEVYMCTSLQVYTLNNIPHKYMYIPLTILHKDLVYIYTILHKYVCIHNKHAIMIYIVCLFTALSRLLAFSCGAGVQDRGHPLLQSGQGACSFRLQSRAQGPQWSGAVVQGEREGEEAQSQDQRTEMDWTVALAAGNWVCCNGSVRVA